jgi:hypothetical protein
MCENTVIDDLCPAIAPDAEEDERPSSKPSAEEAPYGSYITSEG